MAIVVKPAGQTVIGKFVLKAVGFAVYLGSALFVSLTGVLDRAADPANPWSDVLLPIGVPILVAAALFAATFRSRKTIIATLLFDVAAGAALAASLVAASYAGVWTRLTGPDGSWANGFVSIGLLFAAIVAVGAAIGATTKIGLMFRKSFIRT